MKKIITVLSAMALASAVSLAQPPQGQFPQGGRQGGRPGFQMNEESRAQMQDMMSPDKTATRQTDRLKEPLGLTEDQYKKIHKIYKADATARLNAMSSQFGGMMGGFGGGEAGGEGGGFGGGMPAGAGAGGFGGGAGMGQGAGMRGMGAGFGGALQEDEKTIEKRNKKIEKILTPEQYTKYLEFTEKERAEQAERMEQMRKQMEERRQQMQNGQGGQMPQRRQGMGI